MSEDNSQRTASADSTDAAGSSPSTNGGALDSASRPELHQVREVVRFLDSCRVEGSPGPSWRQSSEPDAKTVHTLYHGSAGIALFYLELYQATAEQHYLETATGVGEDLLAYLADSEFLTIGLYSGWPGYVFVLNEIAKASGDTKFREGAKQALTKMMNQSQELGSGVGWIEPIPFSDITGITGDREVLDLSIGAAGAGAVLLYAHRQGLDKRALGWAEQVADRLLEMSITTPDGPNWLMMADMPFPFTAANFAHGAAGVGYLLADLHRETGRSDYLDAAYGAADYIKSKTTDFGDGTLVAHTEENPDLFYLGVCHGPAGTGRLMYLLHEISEDDQWLDWIHHNMKGLVATGAPESRSDGLWNNYGQCCGDAGIGDYALSLYRITKRPEYLALAERIRDQLLSVSDCADDARSWPHAEHRSRPRFVQAQTGYMQGAAGVGSFLLHLATIDEAIPSKIQLPETPFR